MHQSSKIVYIDFSSNGHHGLYLKQIRDALVPLELELIIYPKRPISLCGSKYVCPPDFLLRTFRNKVAQVTQKIIRSFWVTRQVFAQLHTGKIECVFFAMVDQLVVKNFVLWFLPRFLGCRVAGIWFFPEIASAADSKNRILNRLTMAASSGIGDLFILNGNAIRVLGTPRLDSVVVIPEFAEVGTTAEDLDWAVNELRGELGEPVLLLVGDLSPRKGLYRFLEFAENHVKNGGIWRFVAYGRYQSSLSCAELDGMVRRYIKCNVSGRISVIDGFIETEEKFNALMKSSTAIWAVYEKFPHSSNILEKARCMGVPVLVADGGLMAERVRKFKIGYVVDDSDMGVESSLASITSANRNEPPVNNTSPVAEFIRTFRRYFSKFANDYSII